LLLVDQVPWSVFTVTSPEFESTFTFPPVADSITRSAADLLNSRFATPANTNTTTTPTMMSVFLFMRIS
jgi:hypothetical protein